MNKKPFNWMVLFLLAIGCNDKRSFLPLPPSPTISVERIGSYNVDNNAYIMIITYKQLRANRGTGMVEDTPSLIIKTPQELAQYKEQVKFLLVQIEETEEMLKIKEIDKSQLGVK